MKLHHLYFVFLFSSHFIELQLIVNDADNERNKLRRTRKSESIANYMSIEFNSNFSKIKKKNHNKAAREETRKYQNEIGITNFAG